MNGILRKKIVAWTLLVVLSGAGGWTASQFVSPRTAAADPCADPKDTADHLARNVPATTTTLPAKSLSFWQANAKARTEKAELDRQWNWQVQKLSRVIANNPDCFTAEAVATAESYLASLSQR